MSAGNHAEQPGSAVQGVQAYIAKLEHRVRGFRSSEYGKGKQDGIMECIEDARALLNTTPPPAAEQAHIAEGVFVEHPDSTDRATFLYFNGSGDIPVGEEVMICRKAAQPEARGVEGMALMRSLSNWLRTRAKTSWAGEAEYASLMEQYADGVDRMLAAAPNPVRAEQPEGKWKLVPVEPTPEMLRAASVYQYGPGGPNYDHAGRWKAMLASAPAAPKRAE